VTWEFATIPAVDVLDGRAVRLLRGDYDRVELDAGDPLALVHKAASFHPPFIHVVALGAARDGWAPLELTRAVVDAAGSVPVQVGGGVRSPDDVQALLGAGAARVVVGTAAFGPIPLRAFAGEQVAVAIDVADGIVRTNGWLESTELTTAAALERCSDARVATVICTAIDRDGTRSGPDLGLLREVRERFGGRVLAAGGIRDAADVAAVRAVGLDGVIVGRAWLDGTLDLESSDQVAQRPGRSR
jgi:phosphoribosylformimino-5-aminoimidazole carboxamide ribotide isomerase